MASLGYCVHWVIKSWRHRVFESLNLWVTTSRKGRKAKRVNGVHCVYKVISVETIERVSSAKGPSRKHSFIG